MSGLHRGCEAYRPGRPGSNEVSTIRVSGWDNLIPPADEGGTDRLTQKRRGFAIPRRLASSYLRQFQDTRFSSRRKRSKYESKVTKPVVPWKKALPPVSCDTRFNEL